MPVSASTDLVPPADRQAFWTEAICRSFANVETRPLGSATVSGHFEFVEIGNAKLVRFDSQPAVLQPRCPAGEPGGFGRLHVRFPDARSKLDDARRHEGAIEPGYGVLYDARRPFEDRLDGPERAPRF